MSLYRQFRFVAFTAFLGVATQGHAQNQADPTPGKTTDSATPADAASTVETGVSPATPLTTKA